MDLSTYVDKLYQAWVKHNGIRILVDFDDTIRPYSTLSQDKSDDVINTLREAYANDATIVLYTCRSGERLQDALLYCRLHGIPINEVNPETPFLPNYSNKPYCNIMLDDKAGLEQALMILQLALEKYKIYKNETNKE